MLLKRLLDHKKSKLHLDNVCLTQHPQNDTNGWNISNEFLCHKPGFDSYPEL